MHMATEDPAPDVTSVDNDPSVPKVMPPLELVRARDTVFRELGSSIFAEFSLETLALTLLRVDTAFRDGVRSRLAILQPILRPLLREPLRVNAKDLVGKGMLLHLNLYYRNLGDAGIAAFAAACARPVSALAQLEQLTLVGNSIGDDGMSALADAFSKGALPMLHTLNLARNRISDVGIAAFAKSCANGALAELKVLTFTRNEIGEPALECLSSLISGGSLPALKDIFMLKYAPALEAACERRGVEFHIGW